MTKAPKGRRRVSASGKGRDRAPSRSVAIAAAVFAALVVTGAWWLLTHRTDPAATSTGTVAPTATAATGAAREASSPDVLVGRWQRADGGYVLEIRSVQPDGTLNAGYFNPAAIRVSQARVTMSAGVVGAFVELRDVNYPGSTYTLTYDAANDLLVGEYYQALQQQRFGVAFARQR